MCGEKYRSEHLKNLWNFKGYYTTPTLVFDNGHSKYTYVVSQNSEVENI